MQDRLTWKDYSVGLGILAVLFVLLPIGLWQASQVRKYSNQKVVEAAVPTILEESQDSIRAAADALIREVTSTQSYVGYQRTATETRGSISRMCQDITDAASRISELRNDRYFCALFIKRDNAYIRASKDYIDVTRYEYDWKDFDDLLQTSSSWKLYPNDRAWRAKYKVSENPLVILDFEIGLKDPDYRGY